MHTLKIKHIHHEFHYPEAHEFGTWMKHGVRSEFFWAVFALAILIGILITLAILASTGELQTPDVPTYYPYLP